MGERADRILSSGLKKGIGILLPVGIAFYIMYPLLSGEYLYPFAEYEAWKSFVINFIGALKKGELLQWNEYVGSGHPGLYFGHYPVSQNTLFYMLFGLGDFTFYFTKFLGLTILLISFIYACRYLRFNYIIALIGALIYFSVNFIIRVFVAETIGNLLFIYPLLMLFIIKIIDENKKKDILIFSLFYILWLSGGHIIYVYMHLMMFSLFYGITIFAFRGTNALRPVNLKRFIPLYFVLFIIPGLAVLYQYYFIYDVVSASNRLKEGLIVSPFEAIAWKQLIVSLRTSSYFWVGLFLLVLYMCLRLLTLRYAFIKTKQFKIPVWALLLLTVILSGVIYGIVRATDKKFGNDIIANGGFENNTNGWTSHKAAIESVSGGKSGRALQVRTDDDATGYASIAVPTEIGESYKFAVYFKRGTAANGQIKIGPEIDNTNLYYSGVIADNDWRQYIGSFQASTATTYITLANLTSVKDQTSFFDGVAVYKIKPGPFADYGPILKSKVFLISAALYLFLNGLILHRRGAVLDVSVSSLLGFVVIFAVYVSLLSYYFYSPDNIIGDVNGYDYDLFRELSATSQVIFTLSILFSIRDYRNNKIVKTVIFSSIALYILRSHITIPLLRFTGIVWYATRDGSIFSFFFAVLFMFGFKNMLYHFSYFFRNKGSLVVRYIQYGLLIFVLALLTHDSYNKLYKGTSHRFIYPNKKSLSNIPMEKGVLDGRGNIILLNNKLLELNKTTKHFYRVFTPENHYLYLAGNMQQYKIHEAVIYESSISRALQDFYDYTILGKSATGSRELKDVMPYFLFTKHVHTGLGLKYRDIQYRDFFIFSPVKDIDYLRNRNIEFLWDLMQVKYLIIGPEFSKVLEGFAASDYYKLLGNYPKLDLNLYEITKDKSYSKLAVLPLEDRQAYDEAIKQLNSKDIDILRGLYSKLVFLDQVSPDFSLLKNQGSGGKRYYEIASKKEGVLIDFESWNHNWGLKINDKNEKLLKAFQMFKGIWIAPGLNKIDMTYNLKYFKGLFLLGMIVTLIYAVLLGRYYFKEEKR